MNILLVYPKYPNTFWSFKHILKFVLKKAAFPPLGLLTVAAMLPREWNKNLIDLNITELTDEQLKWADLVFISAMIIQKESAQEIINRCNLLGRKVVAGGPLFTSCYQEIKGVDHFVLNEAEITLPLFLHDLQQGAAKSLYYSSDKPDIKKTPLPLWSLINFKDYATLAVQYSRGCPFNCEFCDIISLYGRIPRTKSVDQSIAELQALYDMGWRGAIFIVDDNFIGNKVNVKKLLPQLISWQRKYNYPFKFITEASIDLADDQELMQLMSAANFFKVFLGIESPHIDSLNECGKYQNSKRDLIEAVKIIQRHGLAVMGGFIVGFDSDPETIFESQIKFIQQVGIVTAMVGLLNAAPQSRLWHRLKAEGRLVADFTGENTDGSLNFIPKMDKGKLLAGYKKIMATIYSPKQYYQRINTFIKNYKSTVKSKISLIDLNAFFMSFWKIGVISKSRFLFWKLILTVSFTKIKKLPIAVELAIYGFHFEKFSERFIKIDKM